MRNASLLFAVLLTGALIVGAAVCNAQVPEKMDYQVMLTDAGGLPLADQIVGMVFRIYDQETGGSLLWSETRDVVTNSIGVASVVLGSATPLGIDFSGPRWLEVQANGEVLEPRRELVAAPFARQAHDSDNLGGTEAASFALSSTLSTAGTINSPGNPVDWTKLKGVPAGFADGTDAEGGAGDGSSLDAPDGDPVDALYVVADGDVVIDSPSPHSAMPYGGRLQVTAESDGTGAYVVADSDGVFGVGLFAAANSSSGIVGNSGGLLTTMATPGTPSAVGGIAWGPANGAMLRAMGAGRGAECFSDSAGAAVYAEAYGSGYAGHFVNGSGVLIERGSSFPVLVALNNDTSYWGDVARFASQSGVDDGTWTLYSGCYEGNAARFAKSTDDSQYSTVVLGANVSSEGLYIQGTLVHTALSARALPTSRGTEAVFGVTAPEVEVMASGSGRLSGGAARVEFDRLFAESISGPEDLRVTATPVGAWSALYLAQADASGFTVLSDGGDKGVAFNWVAVGRAKQYRDRPDVSIPDPAEDARVAAEKKAIIEAARPPARAAGPGVATLTAGE